MTRVYTPRDYIDLPPDENPMFKFNLFREYLKNPKVNFMVGKYFEFMDGHIRDKKDLPDGTERMVSDIINKTRGAVNKLRKQRISRGY